MDPRHHDLAAEFCTLVKADDLLAFLGLDAGASAEQALAALKRKRTFFQSMQNNPKYSDQARYLIRHHRALHAVLERPEEHLAHMAEARASSQLPLLVMAIDSVLADGVLDPKEEVFLRENAQMLGIPESVLKRVLRERAAKAGVWLGAATGAPTPPPALRTLSLPTAASQDMVVARQHRPPPASCSWWDGPFTDALLRAVPAGTRRMVELQCGLGWGALTLLPPRPSMAYLGIDTDRSRLNMAERSLRNSPIGRRVSLRCGSAAELPIPDDSADLVLSAMCAHTFVDTARVFEEVRRVLKPGGRFVVVEPDRSGQLCYFDGPLPRVNQAIRELALAVDENLEHEALMWGRPSVSLGPMLGARLSYCGLKPHLSRVVSIQDARIDTMGDFASRLSSLVTDLAAMAKLAPSTPVVFAATEAVRSAEQRVGSQTAGLAALSMPAFIAVGLNA
jgi:SAM-dependent methyltransferase